MVCVVEKGFEVGVYIFFGVVFELCLLNEFFFDWKEKGVFFNILVIEDYIYLFNDEILVKKLFNVIILKIMYNDGNYIVFMGNVCCWLVE